RAFVRHRDVALEHDQHRRVGGRLDLGGGQGGQGREPGDGECEPRTAEHAHDARAYHGARRGPVSGPRKRVSTERAAAPGWQGASAHAGARSSRVTHSMCAVCGNMSYGVTSAARQPWAAKSLRSRASVAGLHETYTIRAGASSATRATTRGWSPA